MFESNKVWLSNEYEFIILINAIKTIIALIGDNILFYWLFRAFLDTV